MCNEPIFKATCCLIGAALFVPATLLAQGERQRQQVVMNGKARSMSLCGDAVFPSSSFPPLDAACTILMNSASDWHARAIRPFCPSRAVPVPAPAH